MSQAFALVRQHSLRIYVRQKESYYRKVHRKLYQKGDYSLPYGQVSKKPYHPIQGGKEIIRSKL